MTDIGDSHRNLNLIYISPLVNILLSIVIKIEKQLLLAVFLMMWRWGYWNPVQKFTAM